VPRVLVTGAGGFVARHVFSLLRARPDTVLFGTIRHRAPAGSRDGDDLLSATLYEGDLTDPRFADEVVQRSQPDWIVHLAAQASVPASWIDPAATLTNNVIAELNILEAVVHHVPHCRVLIVGSSEEYGRIRPEDLPVSEDAALRPDSPYAVSKIAQDFLGLQYFLARGIPVIRVRPFNLIGPGQADQFAIPSFARQIAEAEAGLGPPVVRVGNLEARRDFTDVRDAARAYCLLLDRGRVGEVYNVGSGTCRSIGEMLAILCRQARRPVEIQVDPSRFRPSDAPMVQCDATRIHRDIGWRPLIPIEQSLHDVLEEWRRKTAARLPGGREQTE